MAWRESIIAGGRRVRVFSRSRASAATASRSQRLQGGLPGSCTTRNFTPWRWSRARAAAEPHPSKSAASHVPIPQGGGLRYGFPLRGSQPGRACNICGGCLMPGWFSSRTPPTPTSVRGRGVRRTVSISCFTMAWLQHACLRICRPSQIAYAALCITGVPEKLAFFVCIGAVEVQQ